jgi:putative intracellular protease/amidase
LGKRESETQTTKPLASFRGSDFDVVFFVGGLGAMGDFPTSDAVAVVGKDVYKSGGIVAAVCHGLSIEESRRLQQVIIVTPTWSLAVSA